MIFLKTTALSLILSLGLFIHQPYAATQEEATYSRVIRTSRQISHTHFLELAKKVDDMKNSDKKASAVVKFAQHLGLNLSVSTETLKGAIQGKKVEGSYPSATHYLREILGTYQIYVDAPSVTRSALNTLNQQTQGKTLATRRKLVEDFLTAHSINIPATLPQLMRTNESLEEIFTRSLNIGIDEEILRSPHLISLSHDQFIRLDQDVRGASIPFLKATAITTFLQNHFPQSGINVERAKVFLLDHIGTCSLKDLLTEVLNVQVQGSFSSISDDEDAPGPAFPHTPNQRVQAVAPARLSGIAEELLSFYNGLSDRIWYQGRTRSLQETILSEFRINEDLCWQIASVLSTRDTDENIRRGIQRVLDDNRTQASQIRRNSPVARAASPVALVRQPITERDVAQWEGEVRLSQNKGETLSRLLQRKGYTLNAEILDYYLVQDGQSIRDIFRDNNIPLTNEEPAPVVVAAHRPWEGWPAPAGVPFQPLWGAPVVAPVRDRAQAQRLQQQFTAGNSSAAMEVHDYAQKYEQNGVVARVKALLAERKPSVDSVNAQTAVKGAIKRLWTNREDQERALEAFNQGFENATAEDQNALKRILTVFIEENLPAFEQWVRILIDDCLTAYGPGGRLSCQAGVVERALISLQTFPTEDEDTVINEVIKILSPRNTVFSAKMVFTSSNFGENPEDLPVEDPLEKVYPKAKFVARILLDELGYIPGRTTPDEAAGSYRRYLEGLLFNNPEMQSDYKYREQPAGYEVIVSDDLADEHDSILLRAIRLIQHERLFEYSANFLERAERTPEGRPIPDTAPLQVRHPKVMDVARKLKELGYTVGDRPNRAATLYRAHLQELLDRNSDLQGPNQKKYNAQPEASYQDILTDLSNHQSILTQAFRSL